MVASYKNLLVSISLAVVVASNNLGNTQFSAELVIPFGLEAMAMSTITWLYRGVGSIAQALIKFGI